MRFWILLLVLAAGCSSPAPEEAAKPPKPEEVKVPKGESVTLGAVTEEDLAVPFYPGSKSIANATARTKDSAGETLVSTRETLDSIKHVAAWYAKRLPKATASTSDTAVILSVPIGKGAESSILIFLGEKSGSRIVISRRILIAPTKPDPQPKP